jgi:hypothetical protein
VFHEVQFLFRGLLNRSDVVRFSAGYGWREVIHMMFCSPKQDPPVKYLHLDCRLSLLFNMRASVSSSDTNRNNGVSSVKWYRRPATAAA